MLQERSIGLEPQHFQGYARAAGRMHQKFAQTSFVWLTLCAVLMGASPVSATCGF